MIPDIHKLVNVKLPDQVMNEVTMRSILTVHCSGLSWRDLNKFATILNMPALLEDMPPLYHRIEDESMLAAADDIHRNFNSTSTVPH